MRLSDIGVTMEERMVLLADGIAELAGRLGCTTEHAFDAAALPGWVWSECSAARDAAGPAPDLDPSDLFADTPEREAAGDARYSEIRNCVVALASIHDGAEVQS